MRIIVFGAGAVGGVVGGRLFEHRRRHGREVVLIARGAHYEAMRDRGLTIVDPVRSVTLAVPVVDHPSRIEWRAGDVVVLAMKTQHTEAALADLEAAAGPVAPHLVIACAQNGVENERIALRRFARVYAICVILPATLLVPGEVDVTCTPASGVLDIGRYPAGSDPTAEEIAAAFEASTIVSRADADIMARKYNKLLMNVANAAEAAAGRLTRASTIAAKARAEAVACYEAAGIRWVGDEAESERRALAHITPIPGRERGGGSTWQSLARGSDTVEADFLNGEICLLGRLHGVATPVNDALRRIANRMARNGEAAGSLSDADLETEVGAALSG